MLSVLFFCIYSDMISWFLAKKKFYDSCALHHFKSAAILSSRICIFFIYTYVKVTHADLCQKWELGLAYFCEWWYTDISAGPCILFLQDITDECHKTYRTLKDHNKRLKIVMLPYYNASSVLCTRPSF